MVGWSEAHGGYGAWDVYVGAELVAREGRWGGVKGGC